MAKPTDYLDNWRHGFIRVDQKGRRIYVIRVQRDGKRYKVSTGAHDEKTAVAEYERWAADPGNYRPGIGPTDGPRSVPLVRELVDGFLKWSGEKGHKGHGNTPGHVADQRMAMEFWLKKLGGSDLRRLDLDRDILPPLKGGPQQANRRRTLKSFYSWLRSDAGLEQNGFRLKVEDDPTFDVLRVPQVEPSRRRRPNNKAVPWAHLLAVRSELTGHWKDIFVVQMATGWHGTEIARFARNGSIESYSGAMKDAAGVLICPLHKVGGEHRTAVDATALESAKAVRRYGSFSPKRYTHEVMRVAANIGGEVQPFSAGQLRHSVATNMIERGATVYEVATFLGHRSLETTKKFYATHAIPWNPLLGVNPTKASGA